MAKALRSVPSHLDSLDCEIWYFFQARKLDAQHGYLLAFCAFKSPDLTASHSMHLLL